MTTDDSAKIDPPFFPTVAICGVGLLGGSLGLALHQKKLTNHIVGVGRDLARLDAARSLGVIDSCSTDIESAAAQADLIVLCSPVSTILEHIPKVFAAAREGAIITDVGSTKRSIVERAAQSDRPGVEFVGSHPMAGSEKTGASNARADIYEGATALITPDFGTSQLALVTIKNLWQAIGMRVIEVSPSEHDYLVSALSHLPHIVAAALVAQLERNLDESLDLLKDVAGPGFRDTTRIAMGSPEMWHDICLENSDALAESLDSMIAILKEVRDAILRGDSATLRNFLASSAQFRKHFQQDTR